MEKIKYQFRTIDRLDFGDNRSQLIWSYIFRIRALFIPTLVNAAASGGGFMTICFVLKQNQSTYFNDVGDIIYALQPKP